MRNPINDDENGRAVVGLAAIGKPPMCPQFHPWRSEFGHPVNRHCALHRPRGFVTPSIEEYRRYCTRPDYPHCPWVRDDPGPVSSAAMERLSRGFHAMGDDI